MKSKYFANCKTIEELKKEYRKLAKIHHTDGGGSEEIMKAVNAEYDFLFNTFKNTYNAKAENKENQNTEQPEDFRNIINQLMKLDGLIIEICGSWIWLSGDTYKHKATIKGMGFKWANNKKMWYLGELQKKSRKTMSMNEIRSKYGSEIYASEKALEEAIKNQNSKSLPKTYKDALLQLVDQIDISEKLIEENKTLHPKAEYFDQLVDKNLLTNFRDTAKELKVKEKKFIQLLLEQKYLYRDKKGKLKPLYNHSTIASASLAPYQNTIDDKSNAIISTGTKTVAFLIRLPIDETSILGLIIKSVGINTNNAFINI